MVKRQEIKNLLQKYYNRFYRFQKQEWKKMWQEFLNLAQNDSQQNKKEPPQVKELKVKKRPRMVSYDMDGNKIEPDEPKKCPNCRVEINNVNTDVLIEESNKNYMIKECLECGEKIVSKIS